LCVPKPDKQAPVTVVYQADVQITRGFLSPIMVIKMAKQRPFIRFYVKDHIARTHHLTCEQRGAYDYIQCAMWETDDGYLPNDDAVLAKLAGIYPPNRTRVMAAIRHLFQIDGDRITLAHLQEEIAHCRMVSESKRRNTKSSPSSKAYTLTAPNPFKYNNVGSANAHQTPDSINKVKGKRSTEPRPEAVSVSRKKEKRGIQEEVEVFSESSELSRTQHSIEPHEGKKGEKSLILNNIPRRVKGFRHLTADERVVRLENEAEKRLNDDLRNLSWVITGTP
jgi:uncharacterized protein YdaU (DUF1376 family)